MKNSIKSIKIPIVVLFILKKTKDCKSLVFTDFTTGAAENYASFADLIV